jgi:hypothetical protein
LSSDYDGSGKVGSWMPISSKCIQKECKEIDIGAIILSIGMGLDSSVTAGRPVQLHVHFYTSM